MREFSHYVNDLETNRREAMVRLREVIIAHLPEGFEETFGYNMPAWVVPHSLYPDGYHVDPTTPLPFLNLAAQKRHLALYHMGLYADPKLLAWFQEAYAERVPTKLDMGKSCIRFRNPATIPYDLIGELCEKMTPQDWIRLYEAQRT